MSKIIESTLDVYVMPTSWNFWYSVYGIEPNSHEDLFLSYQKGTKLETTFFQIYTKGHFRDLAKAADELTARMLQDDCDAFGLSLESLLSYKKIRIAPVASDTIYHPAEYLNLQVAREAAQYFCQQNKISPFVKVHFPKKTSCQQAGKSFREDQRQRKEMEGKKFWVILTPQFLADYQNLPGGAGFKIDNLEEVEYAYLEGDHYYAKLKDGTERLINPRIIKKVSKSTNLYNSHFRPKKEYFSEKELTQFLIILA